MFIPPESDDQVLPLLAMPSTEPAPTAAELEQAFASAIRVQNPDIHDSESIDCANCHLAEGARFIGETVHTFVAPNDFSHTRDLSHLRTNDSVTNLHAFSYLGKDPSIMRRTANESAIVAERMKELVSQP
jgi:hypothetical protein